VAQFWHLASASESPRQRLARLPRTFQAHTLLRPYLDAARTAEVPEDQPFAPFTDDAIDMLLDRSNGRPRDLLLKAYALINQGASRNWDFIDGVRTAGVLDSLTAPDVEFVGHTVGAVEPLPTEELWS
jgi:hypothetical protein